MMLVIGRRCIMWQAEAECERLRDQVEAQLANQDTSEDPVIATLRKGTDMNAKELFETNLTSPFGRHHD